MVRPYRAGDGSQADVSGKRVQRAQVTRSCRQGCPARWGASPSHQCPCMVPMNESGSAPPLGTTVTLESQIIFCEA